MSDVFISYSRKDIAFARLIRESLQESQIDTWIDWERIPVGERWWDEICQAIENANVFMFIISKNSIGSSVCKDEINHALKNNKRIIPIIVDDLGPEAIKEFAPDLPQFNWIIFEKDQLFRIEENPEVRSDKPEDSQVALPLPPQFEEALGRLSKAIHTDWEWVKYHTRLQVNALLWESNQRNSSYLVRGIALEESEQQLLRATGKDPQPTGLQVEYVTASRREETLRQNEKLRLEQKARQRQRTVIWTVGIGLVVAVMLGGVAWGQRNQAVSQGNLRATAEANAVAESNTRATAEAIAVEQRDTAIARELAVQSRDNLQNQFDLALLLAIQSSNFQDTLEGRASLAEALQLHPGLERYLYSDPPQETECVAMSPDGKILAGCVGNTNIGRWDAVTGRQIGVLLKGTTGWYKFLLFTLDGKRLISLDTDNIIVFWDTTTWQPVYQIPDSDLNANDPIWSIVISPNGKYLVTGSTKGMISTWDIHNGQKVNTWVGCDPNNPEDELMTMVVNPRRDLLAMGCYISGIHLWKLSSGEKVQAVLPFNTHDFSWNIVFNPDGSLMAYGGTEGQGEIWLWDVDQNAPGSGLLGQPLLHVDHSSIGGYGGFLGLAFSPDSNTLASGYGASINLWDVHTGEMVGEKPLTGAELINGGMVYSPDGQEIITSGGSKGLMVWNVVPKGESWTAFVPAIDDVVRYTYAPDHVVFAPQNDHLFLLTTGCGKLPEVGSTCMQGAISLRDLSTNPVTSTEFPGNFAGVSSLAVSPSGRLASTGHEDGQVTLWNISMGSVNGSMLAQYDYQVPSLDFSSDGRWLAVSVGSGLNPRSLILWDLQQNPPVQHDLNSALGDQLIGTTGLYYSVHFLPAQDILVVGGGTTFILLNVNNGNIENKFQFSDLSPTDLLDDVQDFAISPSGKVIAIATRHQIHLASLPSGSLMSSPTKYFDKWISSVAFSSDGKYLASSDDDGTITLWDGTNFQMITQLDMVKESVFSLAFSPDEQYLAVLGDYNNIHLWELDLRAWRATACTIVNRNLTEAEWEYYLPGMPYQDTCP
jgi:WD40 repeat protein